MYHRSTVILIRIETRFPGAGITLLSVMWMFLLDGKQYIAMWRKSYWTESQCLSVLSTWLFSDHPQGTKEPYRTPAWLSDIWLCVALTKYYFIFGVCDGRQRLKTLYYLFQTILCFPSVTYLLFSYCAFILKVKQSGTDQRARTLYRFLISSIRAKLIFVIKLLLCETELHLSLGDVFVLKWRNMNFELCAQCRTYNATFAIIVSSSYSTVKYSIRDTSTFMDVQFIKDSAAGKFIFTSATVFQTFPDKVIELRENVYSTQSQFQLDDLQALCRTLRLQSIPHRAAWRFK